MQLNYKKLNNPEQANQPNLIILHGLFGMLDNWQTLGRRFAKHFKVYLIDQRNHGKSPHDMDFDYYTMATDLLDFMDEHDLESANIIGHSMGGKTAMQFAVDNSERVSQLIIVDIAPKDYPPGHQNIFDAFFAINLPQLSSRKDADAALSQHIAEIGVRQFLLKNLYRNKEIGHYDWKCNLEIIYRSYTEIINNSLGPYDEYEGATLFVKGANSPRYIEPDKDMDTLQKHFPNMQLQTIANAGHWIHAEQPDAFFEMVMDFLVVE